MGLKPRATPALSEIFASYKTWFGSRVWEDDEPAPYASLQALTRGELANLEREFGILPQSYRDLVLDLGVGGLLIASGPEAVDFTLLAPTHIPQVRQDFLGCIDPELLVAARARQGIDANKMIPFLVDRDWNQWALLANQRDADDRVFLFSHEQEQRDDTDLFAPQGTVETYFRALFANTRKLYSPWYMWTGWK